MEDQVASSVGGKLWSGVMAPTRVSALSVRSEVLTSSSPRVFGLSVNIP